MARSSEEFALAANLGTYRFMSATTALTDISQLTLEFVNIVSRPTAKGTVATLVTPDPMAGAELVRTSAG